MHWLPANSAKLLSSSQSAYCTNSFISGLEKLELVTGPITKWFKSVTIWLFGKTAGWYSLICWLVDTGLCWKVLISNPWILSDPPVHVFLLLAFFWSFFGDAFLFKIRQSVQTSWNVHDKLVWLPPSLPIIYINPFIIK